MKVIFHKTSHDRHGLKLLRTDGSKTESNSLESKSLLRHDLMHFVFEKQAKLQQSFFGTIASGKNLEEMREMTERSEDATKEIAVTEMLVASLQGADKKDFDPEGLIEKFPSYLNILGLSMPAFFNRDFIEDVKKEFLFLVKRYDSLKTGESMELEFLES